MAEPTSRTGSASLAFLVVLLGVGVGVVAVALSRGQRWSRAPALVWQVLQLAVVVPALGGGREVDAPVRVVAWLLAGLAVLAVVGLFVPGVVERDGPGVVGDGPLDADGSSGDSGDDRSGGPSGA